MLEVETPTIETTTGGAEAGPLKLITMILI